MMELMQKETTLDTLARMMVEGFSYMEQRFDRLEERVGTLEQEVRAIHTRIDTHICPVIDEHARRIKDLELAS